MKKVVSDCCDSGVQCFPTEGLNAMNNSMFFCDKCGNVCKTKIVKKEYTEKK